MVRPSVPTVRRAALLVGVLVSADCGDSGRLGPPDSYALLVPTGGTEPGGTPVVRALPETDERHVVKLFYEGFGAEMLRTLYMAKQLVREGRPDGRLYVGAASAAANEGLPVVIGLDREPFARGFAVARVLRAPIPRPDAVWLGLPAEPERDRALVQTVAGRLASYVLTLVISGGTFDDVSAVLPSPLARGYRMAL